ncbi:MAG: 3'-5' exonuclease [bacterium]
MEAKVIIFDTETTGITEPVLIEAAGIIINGSPFNKQTDTFNSRYNPGKPISFGAMATHNILDCDLMDCPPASEFKLPEDTGYLVGHNIDFDWEVIGSPDVKLIDTLPMTRKIWPDFDSHNLGALSYALSSDKIKMREFLINRHSALADVKLCLNVLRHILKNKPELKNWENIYRFSEESRIPDIMPFGKHKGALIKDLPADYKQWLLKQNDIDKYLLEAIKGKNNV